MGKYGKGSTLAFFFFFLVSLLCHAAEDSGGAGQDDRGYQLIARLDWRDSGFKQLMADVEANRRRVFNLITRPRNSFDSAAAVAGSLTVYQYVPVEGDTIFSLAARCSMPYSALASLNRISHPEMVEAGRPLLLPSAPGIFVPQEPQSDLERLLASSHFPPDEGKSTMLSIGGSAGKGGAVFYFFPGGDYSQTERAFFLNRGFSFPLRSYRMTSGFGVRRNPVTGNIRLHEGLDLAAPEGTEVYAAGAGAVTETGNDPIYGNYVVIRHADGWASLYGHLRGVGTTLHATVNSGTLIGWVGSTGQSTGPHLHFELRRNGIARDPDKHLFTPGGR